MKRCPPPSLQFLAAAAASSESGFMSSRPPYRGRNQWRRGYSNRPSGGDGRGQFVTGDSHFRTVRDANRGFHPEERGNFANRGVSQPQPRPPYAPRPPPPFNSPLPFDPSLRFSSPPHFNTPPPYGPGQQVNYPPHFNQNQQFRPQQQFRSRPQKPLDYRNWEFAKPGPPPHCERFKILSYNILADYLAIDHRSKLYFHIPRYMLDWEWRKKNIIFELGLWSADILCFQEVDRFQDLEEELKVQGYSGIWKMRTGNPVDGCAIFWRASRFKLLHEEYIEFSKLGLRDNVAQICVFESLNQSKKKISSELPASSPGVHRVVVCNIHVLYNPKRGEIKLGQIRVLLDKAQAVSKRWDKAPIVLCGDFNCTPKSPLYKYIAEQKLDLSDLPRDGVSGQASAEIYPPRQSGPNFRAHSPESAGGVSTGVNHEEVEKSDKLIDLQEKNCPDSHSLDVPSENSLSQVNSDLNVFDGSSITWQYDNNKGSSCYGLAKETHLQLDGCKDEAQLAVSIPVSDSKGTPISSRDKGMSFSDLVEIGHESTSLDSCHKDICPGSAEMELSKETPHTTLNGCEDDTPSTIPVSVSVLMESRSNPQNESQASVAERINPQEFTKVASFQEEISSKMIETENGENATVSVHCGSSVEDSELNLQTEQESLGCEKRKHSVTGASYSIDVIVDPMRSGASNSDTSSSEMFRETSFASPLKVSTTGNSENLSSLSVADDFMINDKLENLSLHELTETNKGDLSVSDDSSKFLSELHDTRGYFSTDFVESDKSLEESAGAPGSRQSLYPRDGVNDESPGMHFEPIDEVRFSYDPSAWTPMEVETATGNADCLLLEHSLKLRSTYSEVEAFSGTRDSNGEPLVTSYNRCFLGAVDYIWRSEGLQTVKLLAPIPKHAMQWTPGFPTKKWGSDHIALVSELAFTNDGNTQNTEAPKLG